jgi:ABC-type phosphate/phosphonate transport system permease subunit
MQYHLLPTTGGDLLMGFRLRMILWIPTFAYVGFLLLGGKTLTSLGQVVTAAFLGALLGFLLAIMFTLRQQRRATRFAR